MKKIILILFTLMMLSGCRERTVGIGWVPLVLNDENDRWESDIKDVYARFGDGVLEFLIITHEEWQTADDVEFGVFLDTDRDSTTGLNSSQPNWSYTVNDIGADYAISVGFESASDSLLTWLDDRWGNSQGLESLVMEDASDSLICGVLIEDIGSPSAIDLIIIEASKDGEFDYAPDNGHVTFEIE